MPIYEYKCKACGRLFSALTPSSSTPDSEISCPECNARQAEKQLSMRSAVLGSSSRSSSSCGAASGGGFT